MKSAVITDADGGVGMEITRAAVKVEYRIVMACYYPEKAEKVKDMLVCNTSNPHIEVLGVNLPSLALVAMFTKILLKRGDAVGLPMNNAGAMETERHITEGSLECTASVNYVVPYLLTRKLLPLMGEGGRIVNMVSCAYVVGHLDLPDFFFCGRRGDFWRIPIYSDTKLTLTLFTTNLAARIRGRGIVVSAADPRVVSTSIITMYMWFNPLADIFFRPLIHAPKQGAVVVTHLPLGEDVEKYMGTLNTDCHPKWLSGKYTGRMQMQELRSRTEKIVEKWL